MKMSRAEYIEWHINHYRCQPKQSILDKYFPIKEKVTEETEAPQATEKDWEEFWEGM